MRRHWKGILGAGAALVLVFVVTAFGGPKTPQADLQRVAQQAEKNFTTTASLRYQGIDSKVEVCREDPMHYTLTFSEPEALRGMKVVFAEEQVDVQYGSLSFQVDPNRFSSSSAAKMLVSALSTVAEGNGVTVTAKDNLLTVEGTMDAGAFCLRLDRESGNLLSLEVPDSDFSMEFKDFKFFS